GSVSGIMLGAVFLRVVIDSVAKVFKQKPDILEGLVVGILVVLAVAFNELRGTGGLKKQLFPGALGILNILILTLLSGVITAITSMENKLRNGLIAAVAVLILLGLRVVLERLQAARRSQ
ncbi:MAG: hypothetical protein IH899_21285, partial [Planctomycetes bacterium]|nr:hypothetical protein [Planctomycetota bacterium]